MKKRFIISTLVCLRILVLQAQQGYSYYEYAQYHNQLNDAFYKSDSVDYVSNLALMRRLAVYEKNLNSTIGIALHQAGRNEEALESLKTCMKYSRTDTLFSYSFFADSIRGWFQDACFVENQKWKAYYQTHYHGVDSILQLIKVSDQTLRRKARGMHGSALDSLKHLQGKMDSVNWIRLSGILDTLLENFHFIDAHKSSPEYLYLGTLGGHFPEAACKEMYRKTHAAALAGKVNWEQLVGLEWQLMFKYPFREDSTSRYHYLEHLVTNKKGDIDLKASCVQLEAMYAMLHDNSHAQVEISYAARKSNPHLQESLKTIQQFLLDKGISQKQFCIRTDPMPASFSNPNSHFTFIWKQKG